MGLYSGGGSTITRTGAVLPGFTQDVGALFVEGGVVGRAGVGTAALGALAIEVEMHTGVNDVAAVGAADVAGYAGGGKRVDGFSHRWLPGLGSLCLRCSWELGY